MNVLVCVKFVPDIQNVRMNAQHNVMRESTGLQRNPADESAVEAALRMTQNEGSVTILTMGTSACESGLREYLTIGAHRAVLLTDRAMAGADSLATSRTLAAAARKLGPFDLVLCGRRAVDGETGQVPPEIAARLDVPCVTNVTEILRDGDGIVCTRLLENEEQTVRVSLPAVVSLCEYVCPLRMPSLAGYRRARDAEIERLPAEALGLSPAQCGLKGSPTRVCAVTPQTAGKRNARKITPEQAGGVLVGLMRSARNAGESR